MTTVRRSSTTSATLSFALAALFGVSSLIGALFPHIPYRHENPLWSAMGMGQDWIDLLIVVPVLVSSATLTRRGSAAARTVLGGTLIYSVYSLVLYTCAMHFNQLFLVYCGGLGLAFYALVNLLVACGSDHASTRCTERTPSKTTGVFVALLGVAFYALWLAEDIPAVMAGTIPTSITESGLITNYVHVLDLSIVLPAFVMAGVSLYRRHPLGWCLAPMMLVFAVLMHLALAGMTWSMSRSQLAASGPPIGVFIGLAAITGLILWRFVRSLSDGTTSDVARSAG